MNDSRLPFVGATSDSVEEYQFEPIKGYPMLQWHGKRPFRSTHYYPSQLREVHGPEVEGWRNKVYWGDNLQVLSHLLREYRGGVNLVYIDPPFDSRADYRLRIQFGDKNIANNGSAFEEKQYTDIWSNDEYLQFMYERIMLLRELLAKDGVLFLHCDYHIGHLIRSILDEALGPEQFVNENIWKRTTAHGDAKQGARRFDIVHDTILFYSKTPIYTWNTQYVPFDANQIKQQYNKTDPDGRLYRLVTPTAAKPGGNTSYQFHGVPPPPGRYWAYTADKMEEMFRAGRLYFSSSGQPYIKYYLDERPGVAASTLWTDIPILSPTANERVDYPTQKPEALLERIIRVCSNPGDLILDCFMGSGTTQAVAMKLGRRFIGADINLGAVQITSKRLIQIARDLQTAPPPKQQSITFTAGDDEESEDGEAEPAPAEPTTFYTGFEIYNVNHYDIFRNPVEAKDLLIQALEVQPLPAGNVYDGVKDGRMVKIMPVNRIATRADLNDLISNFDYRAFERRHADAPSRPVEKITLVCMGHEPDLAAHLQREVNPYRLDVEVYDILRDGQHLQFKRDSEARVVVKDGHLVIEAFYPMNLLQKLSLQKETVEDWREMVESVMVDWNYDGAVLSPALVDIPDKNDLVKGRYPIPADAGAIRVKITDLLSESWEGEPALL